MTKEEIEKYVKFVEKIIEDNFINKERKEKVLKMLEEIGDRYFLSPASSKKEFHCAFPGGLVQHSINILKLMFKMCETLDLKDEISKESLVLVSLFHDLGKVGSLKELYYVEQTDEWRKNKLGEYYTINKNLNDGLTHAQRSIRLLSQFGIELTDEEYCSILGHDGLYVDSNKSHEMMYNKNKLLRILQFVDSFSTFCIERDRK